jgi:hypothetical protein
LKSWLLGRLRLGGLRFKASLGKKFKNPHLQDNWSKWTWRSSGRVPDLRAAALQVRSPESEPQSHNNNNKNNKKMRDRLRFGHNDWCRDGNVT